MGLVGGVHSGDNIRRRRVRVVRARRACPPERAIHAVGAGAVWRVRNASMGAIELARRGFDSIREHDDRTEKSEYLHCGGC